MLMFSKKLEKNLSARMQLLMFSKLELGTCAVDKNPVQGKPLSFSTKHVFENPQTRNWAKKVYKGRAVQFFQLT